MDSRPENVKVADLIKDLEIDESIVNLIAKRDNISTEQALIVSQQSLQLARAHSEQHKDTPTIEPRRVRHLIRNARVQSWLREKFEVTHRSEDIPEHVVQENLSNPNTIMRNFHPKLHFICQALLKPPKDNEKLSKDPQWQASALEFIHPLWLQLSSNSQEILQDPDCRLFKHVVGLSDRSSNSHHQKIQTESFVIDILVKDRWVEEFVHKVAPVDSPTLLSPFFTEFGLHVVLIPRLLESNLPDDSAPQEELQRLRAEHLRDKMHPAWLRDEFSKLLLDLRSSYQVRLNPELSQ